MDDKSCESEYPQVPNRLEKAPHYNRLSGKKRVCVSFAKKTARHVGAP
jgi:hypothetical protein